MNNTKSASIVFGIAAVVAAAGLTQSNKDESCVFPSKVEVGVLAVFNVQGDDVVWRILPDVSSVVYGQNDCFMATSFKQKGDYLVVAAYKLDGETVLKTHFVQVVDDVQNSEPVPTPVFPHVPNKPEVPSVITTPEPPAPEPEVTEPEVTEPEVVAAPEVKTNFPEVAATVSKICQDKNVSKTTAVKLSTNFRSVIDKEYSEVKALVSDTAKLNRSLALTGTAVVQIQLVISKLKFDGELKTVEDYKDLWSQIERGLNDYVKG